MPVSPRRWHLGYVVGNDSTCASDTSVAEFDVPGYGGIGADPDLVADGNGASMVRLRLRWGRWGDSVVRRPKYNVGMDDDIVAEPNCPLAAPSCTLVFSAPLSPT